MKLCSHVVCLNLDTPGENIHFLEKNNLLVLSLPTSVLPHPECMGAEINLFAV